MAMPPDWEPPGYGLDLDLDLSLDLETLLGRCKYNETFTTGSEEISSVVPSIIYIADFYHMMLLFLLKSIMLVPFYNNC